MDSLLSKNFSMEDIENSYNVNFSKEGQGFFYSKSNVKGPTTFIKVHTAYWKYPDCVSKTVVQVYKERLY